MPKVRKAELSFLYMTCRLVLFYISTKYHQNIPNSYQVTERTQNLLKNTKGNNSKSKTAIVVILVLTRRLVLFYISTKYHQNTPKGIEVTKRTRSFTPTLTPTPTGSVPKTICPPTLRFGWGRGGWGGGGVMWWGGT